LAITETRRTQVEIWWNNWW